VRKREPGYPPSLSLSLSFFLRHTHTHTLSLSLSLSLLPGLLVSWPVEFSHLAYSVHGRIWIQTTQLRLRSDKETMIPVAGRQQENHRPTATIVALDWLASVPIAVSSVISRPIIKFETLTGIDSS